MSIRPRIWTLRKQGEHSAAERVLLGDGWDKVSFHRLLTAPSPYCTVSLLDCRLTGPLGFCSWPAATAPLTTAEEIPYCVLYSFPRTPRTKETVAWLKQQKFIHLQFGSLRVWEINALPEGFGGGSFHASSSLPVVANNPCSYVIPVSISIVTGCFPVQLSPNFPLSIRTSVLGLGLTLIQYDIMLTGLPQLIKPYFKIKSPSQIPWIKTSSYLLRGHNSIYNMCVFMWDRALEPCTTQGETRRSHFLARPVTWPQPIGYSQPLYYSWSKCHKGERHSNFIPSCSTDAQLISQ